MFKPKRIEPGWRYTLAQFVLWLLFGRKWHFISPWFSCGVAACIVPVNGRKVLLSQRAGKVEHAGCWSSIGGYLEPQRGENFAEGAIREFFEETTLHINPECLPPSPQFSRVSGWQEKHEVDRSRTPVGYYFMSAPLTLAAAMKRGPENDAFAWFTEADVKCMLADGRIPAEFDDLQAALVNLFGRIKKGEEFPALKLKRLA
jgi:ADP-ribose pyrophosphatase YjhB (NUDIX family)